MPTSDIKKGPLYVDSTNNRVGIGQSSPATPLHINGAPGTSTLRLDAGGTLSGSRRNWGISAEKYAAGSLTIEYGSTEGAAPSNAAMTIDSSGRVTMPYALAVSSYLNVAHTHPGSGANKVNNWVAGFGTGHIFPSTRAHGSFDYTNSRFIAPVAGLYLMSFKPDYGTAVTTGHYVSFGINGATRNFDIIEDIPININGGANYAAYLYLNPNDYVEMYTHGGATYNLNSGGNQWNTWWFVIQLS